MPKTLAVYKPVYVRRNENKCFNCKHFHQHYINSKTESGDLRFFPTDVGRCEYPILTETQVTHTCQYFESEWTQ